MLLCGHDHDDPVWSGAIFVKQGLRGVVYMTALLVATCESMRHSSLNPSLHEVECMAAVLLSINVDSSESAARRDKVESGTSQSKREPPSQKEMVEKSTSRLISEL